HPPMKRSRCRLEPCSERARYLRIVPRSEDVPAASTSPRDTPHTEQGGRLRPLRRRKKHEWVEASLSRHVKTANVCLDLTRSGRRSHPACLGKPVFRTPKRSRRPLKLRFSKFGSGIGVHGIKIKRIRVYSCAAS